MEVKGEPVGTGSALPGGIELMSPGWPASLPLTLSPAFSTLLIKMSAQVFTANHTNIQFMCTNLSDNQKKIVYFYEKVNIMAIEISSFQTKLIKIRALICRILPFRLLVRLPCLILKFQRLRMAGDRFLFECFLTLSRLQSFRYWFFSSPSCTVGWTHPHRCQQVFNYWASPQYTRHLWNQIHGPVLNS